MVVPAVLLLCEVHVQMRVVERGGKSQLAPGKQDGVAEFVQMWEPAAAVSYTHVRTVIWKVGSLPCSVPTFQLAWLAWV